MRGLSRKQKVWRAVCSEEGEQRGGRAENQGAQMEWLTALDPLEAVT